MVEFSEFRFESIRIFRELFAPPFEEIRILSLFLVAYVCGNFRKQLGGSNNFKQPRDGKFIEFLVNFYSIFILFFFKFFY